MRGMVQRFLCAGRGKKKRDFSHAQADAFAGANAEEKSACSVRNDGVVGGRGEETRNQKLEMGK
jgi:hypothetical protein